MSEQPKAPSSDLQTIKFMVVLSVVCATILSLLASILATPISDAKELDRSKQMLIAAKMLDHHGHFLVKNSEGELILAHYVERGRLVQGADARYATEDEILEFYKHRLIPMLVDDKGELLSFKQVGINEKEYVVEYKKSGYYKQPYKLIYKILPEGSQGNSQEVLKGAAGWVFPINGMGLWDAIYGYLAIENDGVTVIGISWYDQKETPGLGANISEESWQNLFPGKQIFQESRSGDIDVKTAPLGIVVVKGKVSEVYGDSPKAKSAVDGMAGATLTGNGVTDAYREVLAAYRPFLERLSSYHGKRIE